MKLSKTELIDELLNAVRVKANRMTVKELEKLRERNEWISKVRRRKSK